MQRLLIFISLFSSFNLSAQKIDTCNNPIFINYGYDWYLQIDTIKYNQDLEIRKNNELFKFKIDSCLGKINLSYYKNDTLIEKGFLKIQNTIMVDTDFTEDKFGDLLPYPVYNFPAIKIGTWLYWKQNQYIKKDEGFVK